MMAVVAMANVVRSFMVFSNVKGAGTSRTFPQQQERLAVNGEPFHAVSAVLRFGAQVSVRCRT
jgi:hypothetical protein